MEDESQEATQEMLAESGVSPSDIQPQIDMPAPDAASPLDVFIQAGHFNHNSWDHNTGASGPQGNEIDWTPIVRDTAAAVLSAHGVSVIKSDASIKGSNAKFHVKLAVFVHFDGSTNPNAGGASVGYNDPSDEPAASAWKELYRNHYPFGWHSDNYTATLKNYYGYSNTVTSDSEFVIEFGTLSNPVEAKWLKLRLQWLGRLLAHYLSKRLNKGDVPHPGNFA
jgi:N-acetylmuramoyl-L-alanine amidase